MANKDAVDYKCKLCFQEFDSITNVIRHELTHMVNGLKGGDPGDPGIKRRKQGGNASGRKRRKGPKVLRPEVNEFLAELEEDVREGLMNCAEGTELNFLCRLFQPDPENLSKLYCDITSDLHKVLNQDEVDWDVQAFGSIITGMAFKDSDMDFYIRPTMQKNTFKRIFNRVHSMLIGSRLFTSIIPIRHARVPIIKCKHDRTGISLDINLTSSFGVFNSRFISKLFMYDSRIHPLMLIVKIWAKSWDITKTGRMTNYCLVLLVIFYLQNCQKPVLPPLKRFQQGINPQSIDGVNFAFNDMILNRTRNQDTIQQLVINFFKFYDEIDFLKVIISPYIGKILNRFELVGGLYSFPEYTEQLTTMRSILEADKKTNLNGWRSDIRGNVLNCQTPLVVQDPFCLNNNTAKAVSQSIYELFKRQIAHGNKICKESTTSGELLLRLFYENTPKTATTTGAPPAPDIKQLQLSTSLIPAKTTSKSAKPSGLFTCRLTPMETELFYIRLNLRNKFPDKLFKKTDIDKIWCENAVRYTKQTLTELFKFTYKPGPLNNKFNTKGVLTVFADTWTMRKYDSKKGSAVFLNEQIEFGKLFFKERNNAEPFLHCKLTIETEKITFDALTITMEALPDTKATFQPLFNEITSRIRVFFKAYFDQGIEINLDD